jgi:thiamine biosynthesis lipoprotein
MDRAMRADALFRIMGSTGRVLVCAPDAADLARRARARLIDLEHRWSRFRDDSEVSWMNRLNGHDVVVSPETVLLVERALDGWHATGGCFDPTVLGAVLRVGYTADFHDVAVGAADAADVTRYALHSGAGGIHVDAAASTVRLPDGVGFDPGGIGKGLAADLACRELVDAGATGVCIDVGGDVRVEGRPPDGDECWVIDIDDPVTATPFARVLLDSGAVATSSRVRRRWMAPAGEERHHLVDPTTGTCADSCIQTSTVVAAEGWQAEVLTKAAMLGELRHIEVLGAAAIVRTDRGDVTTSGWDRFAAPLTPGAHR